MDEEKYEEVKRNAHESLDALFQAIRSKDKTLETLALGNLNARLTIARVDVTLDKDRAARYEGPTAHTDGSSKAGYYKYNRGATVYAVRSNEKRVPAGCQGRVIGRREGHEYLVKFVGVGQPVTAHEDDLTDVRPVK